MRPDMYDISFLQSSSKFHLKKKLSSYEVVANFGEFFRPKTSAMALRLLYPGPTSLLALRSTEALPLAVALHDLMTSNTHEHNKDVID